MPAPEAAFCILTSTFSVRPPQTGWEETASSLPRLAHHPLMNIYTRSAPGAMPLLLILPIWLYTAVVPSSEITQTSCAPLAK